MSRRGPGRRGVQGARMVGGLLLAVLASPPVVAMPAITPVAWSGAPGATAGPSDEPLKAAGRAAQEVPFVGVLQIRWREGSQERSETLLVQGAEGSVVVKGANAVLASAGGRLVEHAGEDWNLLWPGSSTGDGRPPAGLKYTMETVDSLPVAGRPSRLVEVRGPGEALVERLFLDEATGLLLRREQFEDGQGPVRTIAFESVTIGATVPAPQVPKEVVNATPTVIRADRLPSGVSAPPTLAEGYQRIGLFRRSGVVQALYSDGLYDLSVFEQRGRLDKRGIASDRRVDVSGRTGWHHGWPGGHVVVWQAGGTVFTAVSDAPLSQVMAALRSLPDAGGSTSFLRRLRQVCRALVQPFAA